MGRKLIDLTGKKFGRLEVIKHDSVVNKNGNIFHLWLCKCNCGKYIKVRGTCLSDRKYTTKSCGCLKEEFRKYIFPTYGITHGMSKTHFYRRFSRMHERCNQKYRKYYYQRGIKVCERWNKFENFKKDMYESYLEHVKEHGKKDTSIERKDNDKGYSPENCKWITIYEQNLNRRSNRFLEFGGKRMTYSEWGKEIGGNNSTVSARLSNGWSVERILTTPVKKLIRK